MTAPDLRRNAHVLVLQELRSRFTDSGSPSRTAALDAAISALTERHPVGQEPVGRVMTEFVHWHGKRPAVGTDLYAAPPSQAVHHQAALLAEERAHGETIDQRDRYHEVADELAAHIAHITGVDIGEHSSANSPWQNAIEAAEGYKPEQAVEMSPDFTDTARAAIAWVLWHHQGGSSPVGQPLRFALGMGQHDRMTDQHIAEAKRFAAWAGATTEGFHHHKTAQAVDLAANHHGMRVDYHGLLRQVQSGLRRNPGLAEMVRQLHDHLTVLGKRWYAGDRKVVDELLQLYGIEDGARRALIVSQAVRNG